MLKSIFVPLSGMECDRPALETAKMIASRFGARIFGFHVRLDANSALAMVTHETSWRVEREQNDQSAKARAEFDRVLGSAALERETPRVDAHWHEIEGFPLYEHAFHGRMHDLVVVAREKRLPAQIGEILMRTGRPIVIAPSRVTSTFADSVLVAWNNSAESARAVTAAMPLLAKAKKVVIACVPEPLVEDQETRASLEELRGLFALHGLQAETKILPQARGAEGNALRELAYSSGCDLIVMGAYGHSRLREYVFGGATRDILNECAVPVLMFH